MGLLTDILKEIPQAAVLKEKITTIEAKYAASDTENAILKDDLREAKTEIAKLKKQVEELSHKDVLNETEREILRVVATSDGGDNLPEMCAQHLNNLNPRQAELYLVRLCDKKYLTRMGFNGDTFYSLTDTGRAFVLENNLF